jgi:autotransporter translocation and assembly factor TamB
VLQGEGSVTLGATGVSSFESEIRFDSVSLIRSPHLRVRGRGALRLAGTPDAPRLEGQVAVVRGIYDRDLHPSFGGGGTTLPFDLFRLEGPFFSRLALAVSLDLAGEFQVRNNRVRVAPNGVLELGGTGRQPVLTGAITASGGKLILPRITFDIAHVEVRFPDDDPFRPRVEFLGRGTLREIDIDARASGELFAPEIVFSSSPSYPQEDLVLLVATGRIREEIAVGDVGIVAATELAQLYGPQVWDALFGTGSGGGESILDRVQVGARVSEESGEFDAVSVEVKLKEWLSVFAEQDSDGDSTADLRFFWWLP